MTSRRPSAKRIAADYSTKEKPRWVAGSMGPGANCKRSFYPGLPPISGPPMLEQVRGLIDGGVDLLIVETCLDLLQTKAALMHLWTL